MAMPFEINITGRLSTGCDWASEVTVHNKSHCVSVSWKEACSQLAKEGVRRTTSPTLRLLDMRALAGPSGPNMLGPPGRGLCAPFRAAARSQSGRAAGPRTGVHADAAGPGTDARKDGLSEDMVARLRAAEAEAAALREQLAAARRQAPADAGPVRVRRSLPRCAPGAGRPWPHA